MLRGSCCSLGQGGLAEQWCAREAVDDVRELELGYYDCYSATRALHAQLGAQERLCDGWTD